MNTKTIPTQKFDILLSFLPGFEKPERKFQYGWKGHVPIYPDDVVAFFRWAKDTAWIDVGYDPAIASEQIQDNDYIANASLEEIRSLLTFCVRGERMHDGHWAVMLDEGRVQAILRRLQEIRDSL